METFRQSYHDFMACSKVISSADLKRLDSVSSLASNFALMSYAYQKDSIILSGGFDYVFKTIDLSLYIQDNIDEYNEVTNDYHFKILALMNSGYKLIRYYPKSFLRLGSINIPVRTKTINDLFEKGYVEYAGYEIRPKISLHPLGDYNATEMMTK
jgi:hypothetical protein